MTVLIAFLLLAANPDECLMKGMNESLKSEFADDAFRWISQSGDGEVLAISLLSYAVLGGEKAQDNAKDEGEGVFFWIMPPWLRPGMHWVRSKG